LPDDSVQTAQNSSFFSFPPPLCFLTTARPEHHLCQCFFSTVPLSPMSFPFLFTLLPYQGSYFFHEPPFPNIPYRQSSTVAHGLFNHPALFYFFFLLTSLALSREFFISISCSLFLSVFNDTCWCRTLSIRKSCIFLLPHLHH